MKRTLWPGSALGWWALGLSAATLVLGVLLPFLPELVGRLAERAGGRGLRVPVGLTGAIVEILLAVAAIATGILAFRRGVRSRVLLVVFAAALIAGAFWIAFGLGQLLSPH